MIARFESVSTKAPTKDKILMIEKINELVDAVNLLIRDTHNIGSALKLVSEVVEMQANLKKP